MTTPDDKTPHTNVVEDGPERPNHSPSTSGPHVSTSAPGAGPERDRTVGPVVNTNTTAASALRARSQRSSRPCASQAARSRGQEGMRWSPGGARAPICGAFGDPGLLRGVVVGATGQPWHIKAMVCGGAHTGIRVQKRKARKSPIRSGILGVALGPRWVSRRIPRAERLCARGDGAGRGRGAPDAEDTSLRPAAGAAWPQRGSPAARTWPPPAGQGRHACRGRRRHSDRG